MRSTSRHLRDPDERLTSLDGLRGAAVAMVILFHIGQGRGDAGSSTFARAVYQATELGVWGVDLFFVLSGFLITSILLATRAHAGYFRSFYARRVLRIFPLYYLYLVLLALALALIPTAHASRDAFSRSWPWYAAYLTNVKLVYFHDGDPGSVQHLWSLAIEEHFYLLWPAVVALLSRRALLIFACAGVVLVAAARALWLARGGDPLATYMLSWARADSLLIGAALAVLRLDPTAWSKLVRAAPLIAAVALACAFAPAPALRYTFVALSFAGVLALCIAADEHGRSIRVLCSRPLRRIGTISYGLYVFHFFFVLGLSPLVRNVFGTQFVGFVAACIAVSGATWILAELSFRWLELPALALKRYFPRPGAAPRARAAS
jgi:peptidoglycan/LPS O-acetylase OafA/YrhL